MPTEYTENLNLEKHDPNQRDQTGAVNRNLDKLDDAFSTPTFHQRITTETSDNTTNSVFSGRSAMGTDEAPEAVVTNKRLATFAGSGFDGTGYNGTEDGSFEILATQTFDSDSHGTKARIQYTPTDTTTRVTGAEIDGRGLVLEKGLVLPLLGSAPPTPASGFVALYAKADGKIYKKDSAGTETEIG